MYDARFSMYDVASAYPRMQDARFRMQDARFRMYDVRCTVQASADLLDTYGPERRQAAVDNIAVGFDNYKRILATMHETFGLNIAMLSTVARIKHSLWFFPRRWVERLFFRLGSGKAIGRESNPGPPCGILPLCHAVLSPTPRDRLHSRSISISISISIRLHSRS